MAQESWAEKERWKDTKTSSNTDNSLLKTNKHTQMYTTQHNMKLHSNAEICVKVQILLTYKHIYYRATLC